MSKKAGSGGPTGSPRRPAPKQQQTQDVQAWRAIWLRCVEAAHREWDKIPYNDLALSGGDRRKLIALLEMHYDLADGEAPRKVDAFLRQCQPRA